MGRFRGLLDKVKDKAADRLGLRPEPRPSNSKPVPEDWNQAYKEAPSTTRSTDFTVRFENLDVELQVARGTTILDAALAGDVDLNHYCGGMASCGSCLVTVVSGKVSGLDDMEEATLDVVLEDDRTDRTSIRQPVGTDDLTPPALSQLIKDLLAFEDLLAGAAIEELLVERNRQLLVLREIVALQAGPAML